MAVYTDAASERLSRSANLPSPTSFTFFGWARVRADRGALVAQPICDMLSADFAGWNLSWETGTQENMSISSRSAGGAESDFAYFASRPPAGSWFFWWVRCSGTGADQLEAGWRLLGSDTWVTVAITATAFTPAMMGLGDLGGAGSFWSNMAFVHTRCSNAVLNNTQLLAESKSLTPILTSNFAWRLASVATLGTTDLSGNNRQPTVSGTLGDEADPALDTAYTLVVQDATHAHSAESPTLSEQLTLSVADARHTQTADTPTLAPDFVPGTALVDLLNGWLVTATASDATFGTPPFVYQWQRSPRAAATWVDLTGQTALELVDRTVAASTNYDYRLRYTDDADNVVFSNTLQVDVPAQEAVWTVVGDSQTDEYRADDNRAAGEWEDFVFAWIELLAVPNGEPVEPVHHRALDVGAWGTRAEPRRSGFANMWARSGATMETLLADQLAGAVGQVAAGTATHGALWTTANEWVNPNDVPTYHQYIDEIYNSPDGGVTTATLGITVAQVVSDVVGRITDVIDAFVAANVAGFVVVIPPDYTSGPMYEVPYPDATRRGYVTAAIESLETQVEAYVAAINASAGTTVVSTVRQGAIFDGIWETANGTTAIVAGVEVNYMVESDNAGPLYFAIVPDGVGISHPGALAQSIYANTFLIGANNLPGISITPFSDAEIRENANLIAAFANDALHGHTADSIALIVDVVLSVHDATHATSTDAIGLSQANLLSVDDALHATSSDQVTLIQANVLSVEDAVHAHFADQLDLQQGLTLSPADAVHATSSDEVALTQANTLAVDDALHATLADELSLSFAATLSVADARHVTLADTIALSQGFLLIVQDATHAHIVDSVSLSLLYTLVVADALHAHAVDTLDLIDGVGLDVHEARHATLADTVALTQANTLSMHDALHVTRVDSPTLSIAYALQVEDARHAHLAESPELSAVLALNVQDALHAHFADGLSIIPMHVILSVHDAWHAHRADSPGVFMEIVDRDEGQPYPYESIEAVRFGTRSGTRVQTVYGKRSSYAVRFARRVDE